MNAVRLNKTIEKDGELVLTDLPCKRGAGVEVIVLIPEHGRTAERDAAVERFLQLAQESNFRSTKP